MTKSIFILYFFLPLFLVGISSCEENEKSTVNSIDQDKHGDIYEREDELSPLVYAEYWNDLNTESQFVKKKKIGEVNYTLKYLPTEFLISNELGKVNPSEKAVNNLRKDYEGMEYYELKIQIDDFNEETIKYQLRDMTEYQNRLSYLSFNMQKDLTMAIDKEKIVPCKLYHYERTYGLAPYAKVLIGFSKEDIGKSVLDRTIVLNDQLFNKGLIKFNYSSTTLLEIPKIAVL